MLLVIWLLLWRDMAQHKARTLLAVLSIAVGVFALGLALGTGLDSGQVGQLLQIAAPLLMGALGQQQQQQGLDPNSLSAFPGGQQQMAQQSNPDMMSMLNSLLDMDKDGSALNDVLGLVGKLLGGDNPYWF